MDFSVEMANMASSENKGINQRNENRDGKREKQQHTHTLSSSSLPSNRVGRISYTHSSENCSPRKSNAIISTFPITFLNHKLCARLYETPPPSPALPEVVGREPSQINYFSPVATASPSCRFLPPLLPPWPYLLCLQVEK